MSVSIDTGGGGGKKRLDTSLNLVPFIDLLVVNICFLLMTAVWTQMARIEVSQKQKSSAPQEQEDIPPEQRIKLVLIVEEAGYTLQAGPERISIPRQGEVYDREALGKKLKEIKERLPDKTDITVASEDDIKYDHIIAAMDACIANGYPDIALKDASI